MKKYVLSQTLEVSDREGGAINRIAVQVSVTGENDNEKIIGNVSRFCLDTIEKYMNEMNKGGVENGIKE